MCNSKTVSYTHLDVYKRQHLGHMVNKILKDVCIKANDDLGKSSSIKHNWDCHGLPIELQVKMCIRDRLVCMLHSILSQHQSKIAVHILCRLSVNRSLKQY